MKNYTKHLFLNVIFSAMNCLVIALHQTHSELFLQNQYFVKTVAKAESASGAFLESREGEWVGRGGSEGNQAELASPAGQSWLKHQFPGFLTE